MKPTPNQAKTKLPGCDKHLESHEAAHKQHDKAADEEIVSFHGSVLSWGT